MSFEFLSDFVNPEDVIQQVQLTPAQTERKQRRDEELKRIIRGQDQRFLAIVGPCSANDENAVCEYVYRLAALQEEIKEKVFVIPRIYTNKPRTNGSGYKGMLHQPDPHGKPDLVKGIMAIRHLHVRVIAESGLTTADEMLYPENYEYVKDLISYIAIGARSVEDQQHRFVASGMDEPVGLKNPTSGDLNVLFNSVQAAHNRHRFLYNRQHVESTANPYAHVVLRGALNQQGENIPNYHYETLEKVAQLYLDKKFENPFVVVDTNHDNSGKRFREQIRIAKEVLFSRGFHKEIHRMVRGFMIESFIEEGRQDIEGNAFGKSITDPCLGWDDTKALLYTIAERA